VREVAGQTRPVVPARAAQAEAAAEALPLAPEYEGLVTRAIAFAIDAAIISAVAVIVGAAVGISLSVLSVPSEVETALFAVGGAACLLWSTAYFVTFWSATGQTPGDRVLGIRVCRADDGQPLRPFRALLRLVVLTLSVIPLFAGLLPILFDDRRRGVHDMAAGSVVVGSLDETA
jgi:uncharacterized RDD family membrane protein YckC